MARDQIHFWVSLLKYILSRNISRRKKLIFVEFYCTPPALTEVVKSYYYHFDDSITIFCISELLKE